MRGALCFATLACLSLLAGCDLRQDVDLDKEFRLLQSGYCGVTGAAPESQPELPANPQLRDMIVYAALSNPDLQTAFGRWKATVERIQQEKYPENPELDYSYFIVPQMMADGALRHMIGFAQPLPWIEKLALRSEVAAKEAAAEWQRFEAARLKMVYEVSDAYYEYFYLARAVTVMQENLSLVRYLETAARSRYQAGPQGSLPDLVRSQLEVGKLENDLAGTKDLISTAVARLNAVMNRPVDEPLPAPAASVAPTSMPDLPESQLLGWLAENNPELKALGMMTGARGKDIELAKKNFLPDFTIGGGVELMTKSADSLGKSPRNPVTVSVGMSLPIWWEKYAASVRQAKSSAWSADRERVARFNALAVEVYVAAYRYRDAQRRMTLYKQRLLPRVQEALRSNEAAYRAGQGQFRELVESQQQALEFQLEYERARADQAQRLAELESLIGRPIPLVAKPAPTSARE